MRLYILIIGVIILSITMLIFDSNNLIEYEDTIFKDEWIFDTTELVSTNNKNVLLIKDTTNTISLYEVNMLHLKFSEGLRLNEYKCAAGVSTIGWGATNTGLDSITYEKANIWTQETYNAVYRNTCKRYPLLNRQQALALSCFRYNVTIGPNLNKALIKNNTKQVIKLMAKYVNVNNKPYKALVERRQREILLYTGNVKELKNLLTSLKPLVQKEIYHQLK